LKTKNKKTQKRRFLKTEAILKKAKQKKHTMHMPESIFFCKMKKNVYDMVKHSTLG